MERTRPHTGKPVRSKENIIQNYNRISKWYDTLAGNAETRLQEAGLRLLNPSEGECILEIGFGTGHSVVGFARAVRSSGRVYGIDISQRMLAIAKTRVAAAGVEQTVTLCCGDALGLPYSDNSFDGIFMAFTLETFDESEVDMLLQQCKRVLKANGRLVDVSMSQQGKRGIMMKVYKWAHVTFPKVVDCRPIYLEQTLRTAGFEVAKATVSSFWGLSVEMVEAMNSKDKPDKIDV
jgi:ubiquinone/menaquinone biosynthesis C-methylase UbiE